jgi:hypothetical protein
MTDLTINETAEHLGVTRQRVDALIRNGSVLIIPDTSPKLVHLGSLSRYEATKKSRLARPRRGWCDVHEAAKARGCHPDTIRAWITQGLLKATDEGAGVVMRISDVKAVSAPRRGRPPIQPVES